MTTTTDSRADLFRRLHADGVLVLPNAWDVASARLVERAGAVAVATTSAGVAWSLGAPDGGALGRERAVAAVERIAAAVSVPVTADIEDGYGESPEELAATVRAVAAAGAVGINLEDSGPGGLRDPGEQAERIAVAREAGGGIFVNARTDTYLRGVGELAETVHRAEAYVAAGADGVFVPGLLDPAVLRELTAAVPVPVNVLVGPGAPTVAELAAVGVRRVSAGSSIAAAAYGLVGRAAAELLGEGTYAAVAGALDYAELNRVLAG